MNDVRVVALVCLTAIEIAAIVGLTVVAVLTDRELRDPETFTLALALWVAALGGLNTLRIRRRHRWRVEREDVSDAADALVDGTRRRADGSPAMYPDDVARPEGD